jgi:DTW domain-containing protein YfiP
MHPKEFKQVKAATGRFAHLCLQNSVIYMGVNFNEHKEFQTQLRDPRIFPVLLYPGQNAINLSENCFANVLQKDRQLAVILLDATWHNAKKMFDRSTSLHSLPRLAITPAEKSRYLIKRQPNDWCLSTIEAVHELMQALEKAGFDKYDRPEQMLDLFDRMQAYQIKCMLDPCRQNYRPGLGKQIEQRISERKQPFTLG